jgi:hypothetical protein
MTDEIRKRYFAPEESETELTTADLANTRQTPPTDGESEAESIIEAEMVELPDGTYSNEVNRTRGDGDAPHAATAVALEEETGPLFSNSEAKDLRSQWDTIQVGFVDEPRRAVEQADHLVAGTMKRLAEIFAEERGKLESQWDKGENVSTEDLRLALRRYRSFFSRLLAI